MISTEYMTVSKTSRMVVKLKLALQVKGPPIDGRKKFK